MTVLIVVILLVGLVAARYAYRLKQPLLKAGKAVRALSTENLPQADAGLLREHVDYLCQSVGGRQYDTPQGLSKAATYIEGTLEEYGYEVRAQKYMVGTAVYKNLTVVYGPADKPRIVIGAHYDAYADSPGADHNASGTAGLLELMRLQATHKPELPFAIEGVFYSLGEAPYAGTQQSGSYIHAESAAQQRVPIRLMIALSGLGYFDDKANSQYYPYDLIRRIYPSRGNFMAVTGDNDAAVRAGSKMLKRLMRLSCSVPIQSFNAPASVKGINTGNNLPYRTFGYSALELTDTGRFRNPHYLQSTDRPDTLDYGRMASVVSGLYFAVIQPELLRAIKSAAS